MLISCSRCQVVSATPYARLQYALCRQPTLQHCGLAFTGDKWKQVIGRHPMSEHTDVILILTFEIV
jgi:hypothetical protein